MSQEILEDIPVIEVAHLPSAASFYAAITQPLDIRFLSALPSPPGALHFGFVSDAGPTCIFTLQQSAVTPPPLCHITLLAPSPDSLHSFYNKSLLAHNAQRDHSLLEVDGELRARTRDLDGNMLEAVYSSRRRPTIETASSKEARRVLEWQHDVAKSVAASGTHSPSGSTISTSTFRPPPYQRADSFPTVSRPANSERPMRLVRRETITTEHYRRPDEGRSGGGGSGFNGMKLVGTLLGAAAGAAVAYAMVRSESPSRTHHHHSPSHAQSHAPRRASYDDTAYPPIVQRMPARSYVSRAPEAEPQYVAQYTIAAPPSHSPRRIEDSHSRMSHVSARTGRSEKHSTRERSRSEVGSRYERPLAILPGPGPKSHVSGSQRSKSYSHRSGNGSGDGRESYVTARSKRTGDVQYITADVPRSRHGSSGTGTGSTTTIRLVPQGRSEVGERRSEVGRSEVGSRIGGGGYAASVAPSDSVSSVGFKRERERLRDRMRERY